MLVALTICSRAFRSPRPLSFLVPLAFAGFAYLLAIREFFFTPVFPKRVVLAALVLSAIWHGLFLRLPPGPDDDVHRYLWDGRVQRLGYSPDRKSTRLNSSHLGISYAVFCLKKKSQSNHGR